MRYILGQKSKATTQKYCHLSAESSLMPQQPSENLHFASLTNTHEKSHNRLALYPLRPRRDTQGLRGWAVDSVCRTQKGKMRF